MENLPFENISIEDIASAFGDTSQLMSLMDVCGFFLCQHGSADVSLNGQTFHIEAGDVYIYTPSTFVSVLNRSQDIEGIAVKCQLGFVLPMLERIVNPRDLLSLREAPCFRLPEAQKNSLESLLEVLRNRQMILRDLQPDSTTYSIMQQLVLALAEAVVHELLFDYAINKHLVSQAQDSKDRIFQLFLMSLFKNYKREREVAFYADEQCLSPRYFSSIIKEKTGHSASQWIIQMVISSIKQVLRTTDYSVKEVAMQFNFPSQSFFGKYFKQYVGVSPKEYRMQVRSLGPSPEV